MPSATPSDRDRERKTEEKKQADRLSEIAKPL